jgi:hypothetical protein
MKIGRRFTWPAGERRPQLLGPGERIRKRFAALSASFFQWTPARQFARRYIVPRVLPQMMTGEIPTQEMAAVRKRLRQLADSGRSILVGPWVSEVGFELLYWIPFLSWVRSHRAIDPERLIVVSRGGVASWYRHVTHRYVDLFDFYTPEAFRANNSVRLQDDKQKQLELTEFDREIVEKVSHRLGMSEVELLHPMFMYKLFYPFWKNKMSMHLVEEFTSFRPLLPPDSSALDGQLPSDFVAVRFYFNESFPDSEQNRGFVARVIETLTESIDVVLLNPDLQVDDHRDAHVGVNERLHSVGHLITPQNNLRIQTEIVSRARAFVGTYGGLSYVAPLLGVDALAFYSDRNRFSAQHLDLARRKFADFDCGTYVVLDTRDVDVLGLLLGSQKSPGRMPGQFASHQVRR